MGQTIEIIWVAVRALLQVFIVVGVGAISTHAGYLSKETLSNLGRVRIANSASNPSSITLIPCNLTHMPI